MLSCLSLRDYVSTMHKNSAYIRLIFIFVFLITGCCGALDRTPENATLYADGELRLNCNSTIDNPVVWFFTEEGSDTREKLTTGGALTASFKDTFMIHPVSKYDLIAIMTNVTEPYCGYYECVDDQNKRGAETANATVATVSSPACNVEPHSATEAEVVTYTCSVTVCGSAIVPMSITVDGTIIGEGTDTATWKTTGSEANSTPVVMCMADFGGTVKCPNLPLTTTSTNVASATELLALSVYAMFAFIAHRLSM